MLNKKTIEKILKQIAKVIPRETRWAVIAGANLALRGRKNNTNDLDIATTKEGFDIFKNKLGKFIISKGKVLSNYESANFLIDSADIEVLYDDFAAISYTKFLINGFTDDYNLDGVNIKLLKLEKEKEIYIATNRREKADLIRLYEKNNH